MKARLLASVVVAVPLLALAGVGPVRAVTGDEEPPVEESDPGVPYDPDAEIVLPESPDPCLAIVDGGEPGVDELAAAGLDPATVPQFLVDQFDVGGVYCLADLTAQVVEGVYTEFWSDGTLVARWLIPGTAMAGSETWPQYLESLTGGGDADPLDHGVISILPSAEAPTIQSEVAQMGPSDYVSLWAEVATQLVPDGPDEPLEAQGHDHGGHNE